MAAEDAVFVSLRSLLDASESNPSYWKVVPKSSVVSLTSLKTTALSADDTKTPCIGSCKGQYGHLFFKNGEYAEMVYENSYLENDPSDVSLRRIS